MLIKIIAMILHEIVKEYQKLQPEKEHPDESVLSFSTALSPERTVDDVELKDAAEILGTSSLPLDEDGGYSGSIIGFNKLERGDLRLIKEILEK